MSELKGQLFGIILVILMFAAVGAGLATMFSNNINEINQQESQAYSEINANY
ncbi:MAG: hypothetical protein RBS24_05075 [Bacilli bacterium]|jgi:flagellar basal body-associated protein FliL|nr:hypothetical protein [Bacilli bacterium]